MSEKVATDPHCPVAVIPADAAAVPTGPVVVGLDDGRSCADALAFAAEYAQISGSELYTLQAYDAQAPEAKVHISHTTAIAHIVTYGIQMEHHQTVTTDHIPNPRRHEYFARRQHRPMDGRVRTIAHEETHPAGGAAQHADNAAIHVLTARSDALIHELNRTHPTIDMVRIVHPGTAAEVLIEASERAAVIVVGTRTLNWWQRLLHSSTSRHVALKALSPVVVVPQTTPHALTRGSRAHSVTT